MDDPREWTTDYTDGYRAGAEAMRDAVAQWLMCGCDLAQRCAVVTAATTDGLNSAARWRACHRGDCLALLSAEALELPLPEPPRDG